MEQAVIRATTCLMGLLVSAEICAEWRYDEVEGDVEGTTAYLLQADSSIAVTGSDGKEHHPFIQLRCDEDGGEPYWRIHWFAIVDANIGSSSARDVDNVRLQVRVDGKRGDPELWRMTRDESLEGVTTLRARALAKALRDANQLDVRVSGGYGKTYDATFDVSGLEAALERLKRHCKKL
jgi:hypothetical protein